METSVNRAASGIERSLGRAARTGLFAVGAGAAAAATGVGLLGLSFYRTQQSASIAFKTMLGDGGKARRFLGELAKFAKDTPFEFPDLIRSTQKLLAFGFEAKKVIPILTDVGNKVAAMGGDPQVMEQTIRALGQVRSRGKLMAEEMNQFIDANTFGWLGLAAALGVTTAKAQEMVTKGLVSSEMAIAAFRQSARGVAGMMDEQAKSFTGLLSTFKDNISAMSATALTPLFESIERGMARANKAMGSPEGEAAIKRLATFVERDLVGAIQRLIDWVGQNRDAIVGMASDGAAALGGLLTALHGVGKGLRVIADQIGGWDKLFYLLLTGRLLGAVRNLTAGFTLLAGSQAAAGATGIGGAAGAAAALRSNLLALPLTISIAIRLKVLTDPDVPDWAKVAIIGQLSPLSAAIYAGNKIFGDDKPKVVKPSAAAAQHPDSRGGGAGGIQLPTRHAPGPIHQTSGLSGYPAVDYFGTAGQPILAPEDGVIFRHSGRGGVSGQTYGWSLYFDGYETGTSYYIQHLMWRAPLGEYKRGDTIGKISFWADKPKAAHAHVGIQEGGATRKPGSAGPGDSSAASLIGDPTVTATNTRTTAQTAAQRALQDKLERLAEGRGLRSKFGTLAKDAKARLGGFDEDTTEEILGLIQSGNLVISRAFKDKLITEKELKSIDGAFERLQDRLEKGVEKVRDAFNRSFDRFRDLVSKALSELGGEATLDRRRQALVASDATALIGQVLGGGDVSDEERRVQAAGDRVRNAWAAYSKALTGGNREAIETAAGELAEAEKRFESLSEQGLQERAGKLFEAYKDLIGVVSAQERKLWATMSSEQEDAVQTLLDTVQEKLGKGKMPYAEARKILSAELQKLGLDVAQVGQLLGDPFQQTMIRALSGIEAAVLRLIAALKGVKAEAEGVKLPAGHGIQEGAGFTDAAPASRFLSSAVQPITSVAAVTPIAPMAATATSSTAAPVYLTFGDIDVHLTGVLEPGGERAIAEQLAEEIRNALIRRQRWLPAGTLFE